MKRSPQGHRVESPRRLGGDLAVIGKADRRRSARAVRQDPALQSTLLVALSGYALPEDLERAAQAGFQHHLAKPPSVDMLERVLAALPETPPPLRLG